MHCCTVGIIFGQKRKSKPAQAKGCQANKMRNCDLSPPGPRAEKQKTNGPSGRHRLKGSLGTGSFNGHIAVVGGSGCAADGSDFVLLEAEEKTKEDLWKWLDENLVATR